MKEQHQKIKMKTFAVNSKKDAVGHSASKNYSVPFYPISANI